LGDVKTLCKAKLHGKAEKPVDGNKNLRIQA
jgi:hypothetical protein